MRAPESQGELHQSILKPEPGQHFSMNTWCRGDVGALSCSHNFGTSAVHRLADMGHSIVGVDVSEQALKEFFADQGLPYREEPVPGISGAKKLQVCLLQCQTVCCVQPCTAGTTEQTSPSALCLCLTSSHSLLLLRFGREHWTEQFFFLAWLLQAF